MELFKAAQTSSQEQLSLPLPVKMTPLNWDEFIGQEHLIHAGSPLKRAIEADRLGSSIFFGPPGTGKTALARLAAKKSNSAIEYLNAVTAGVADIRQVVKRAIDRRKVYQKRTLLIIDEIHHFNRSQQDALLPDVERGNLTMVGLTTENPYFYVNAALMSRSGAYEFRVLSDSHMMKILDRALVEKERGFGEKKIRVELEAKKHLVACANGDARRLLNSLELAIVTTKKKEDGLIQIDLAVAEESAQKKSLRYDKKGDDHYDTISAFIKSVRGSDPDAALYWMAKMLKAGEDPRFIARRMVILASEDVGNADPVALSVATAAFTAVEKIGMPEARIVLAQAATYLASVPKSNAAFLGIEKALKEVEKGPLRQVPTHLKDASRDGTSLGHGQDYLYPHNFPDHYVFQEYMPDPQTFYEPTDQGYEVVMKNYLSNLRKSSEKHLDEKSS